MLLDDTGRRDVERNFTVGPAGHTECALIVNAWNRKSARRIRASESSRCPPGIASASLPRVEIVSHHPLPRPALLAALAVGRRRRRQVQIHVPAVHQRCPGIDKHRERRIEIRPEILVELLRRLVGYVVEHP